MVDEEKKEYSIIPCPKCQGEGWFRLLVNPKYMARCDKCEGIGTVKVETGKIREYST